MPAFPSEATLFAAIDPAVAKTLIQQWFQATYGSRGTDIASGATINLTTASGDIVDVTGTTAITAITLADGVQRTVRFTGALTLTNGASLVLPSGANITTAAGDFAVFRGYAAGVVRCIFYSRASGYPVKPQSEPYIYVRDEKASGAVAGSSIAGTQTRTLNTEVSDTGNNATLASNQITLAPGTYRVRARAPAYRVGRHRIRLRNVTAGTTLLLGASSYTDATSGTPSDSTLNGRITVAAGQALELQHFTTSVYATTGLGVDASSGESEVYSEIEFWKES